MTALALREKVRVRFGKARSRLGSITRRSYDRVRALDPTYPRILLHRGDALLNSRDFAGALACYERVLKLAPNNIGALYQRAIVLRRLRRSHEALASLDRALALKPDFVEALISRGKVLRLQGDIEAAVECFRQAAKLRPNDSVLHSTLIFSLNFDPALAEVEKQRERAEWNQRHAQKFRAQWKPHDNEPDPERRLRIGYLSKYFRHDNAAYGFGNAILHRNSEHFEVSCYSDSEVEDDATVQLREKADHFHRTAKLSDDELAELIRRDRIDILIDCVGHMNGNRLLVMARKPAPVQVTAWGEPTGTGLEAIDYLFSSPVLVPQSDRALFAERVIDFPNFTGFWSPDSLPDVGPLPALSHGHVTFGSFNRILKLSEPTLRCWASILRKIPGARLILKDGYFADPAYQSRVSGFLQAQGVPASALTFFGRTDRQTHFACYNLVDIGLDPFPHAGGMTTLDALWMGVPVISWPGKSVSSRWAATSLVPLGLTDFLADSAESYVELAVAKAADLQSLAQLRASLRNRVATSEFGDGPNYCRLIEAAYRKIWREWCAAHATELQATSDS